MAHLVLVGDPTDMIFRPDPRRRPLEPLGILGRLGWAGRWAWPPDRHAERA